MDFKYVYACLWPTKWHAVKIINDNSILCLLLVDRRLTDNSFLTLALIYVRIRKPTQLNYRSIPDALSDTPQRRLSTYTVAANSFIPYLYLAQRKKKRRRKNNHTTSAVDSIINPCQIRATVSYRISFNDNFAFFVRPFISPPFICLLRDLKVYLNLLFTWTFLDLFKGTGHAGQESHVIMAHEMATCRKQDTRTHTDLQSGCWRRKDLWLPLAYSTTTRT